MSVLDGEHVAPNQAELIAATAAESYRHDLMQARSQLSGLQAQLREATRQKELFAANLSTANTARDAAIKHHTELRQELHASAEKLAELEVFNDLLNDGLTDEGPAKLVKAAECFKRARELHKKIANEEAYLKMCVEQARIQRAESQARRSASAPVLDLFGQLKSGADVSDGEIIAAVTKMQATVSDAAKIEQAYFETRAENTKLLFSISKLKEEAASLIGYGRALVREAYEQPPADPKRVMPMSPSEKLFAVNRDTMIQED